MCMVSFITTPTTTLPLPTFPWNHDSWADYKEIIRRLEVLDEKLGQPDCHDPAKASWMKEVEDRLAAVEKRRRK